MNILYAVCSLGLGHATRSLPLIKTLIDKGENVYILSHSIALELLKKELGDSVTKYIDFPGYPPLERGYGKGDFYFLLFRDLLKTASIMFQERLKTHELARKYNIDRIVSDGRYGIFSLSIPSFLISHQIRFMIEFFAKLVQTGGEIANGIHFLNFRKIFVPDYEDFEDSLSGNLSHNLKFISKGKLSYLGILSSYEKLETDEDIDYLFIISGYIMNEKTTLMSKLINSAKFLDGKKVFLLGNPSEDKIMQDKEHNMIVYSYVSGRQRLELMNRAKFVVSRSGYTTIMDLAELNKKALLIPTPGMSEQAYLGKFHKQKGTFYSVEQDEIDLIRDIKIAKEYTGMQTHEKTTESIKHFLDIIYREYKPWNPVEYIKKWPLS